MDTDRILENSAHAFAVVACTIQRDGFGLESHSLVMASTVNAGLALELYAKCLRQLAVGDYPKSHNLKNILKKLPGAMQSELQKAFDESVTDERKEEIRQVETQSGLKVDTDFHSVVANWSRVFVEGRYWFETAPTSSKPPLHWFFFEELVRVLRAAIDKQRS